MKNEYQHRNPFHFLKEASDSPLARIARATMFEKCIDTFNVYYGHIDKQLDVITVGLIDYLSFGLTLGVHQLAVLANQKKGRDFQALFLFIPLMGLYLCSVVAKVIASAILTICSLPLIGLTHAMVGLYFQSSLSALNSILGKDKSSDKPLEQNDKITLAQFLSQHLLSLNDLQGNVSKGIPIIQQGTNLLTRNILGIFSKTKEKEHLPVVEAELRYQYPEQREWFSSQTLYYPLLMLTTLFPYMAIFTAPSLFSTTSSKMKKALTGPKQDKFQFTLDLNNADEKKQYDSLVALNVGHIAAL